MKSSRKSRLDEPVTIILEFKPGAGTEALTKTLGSLLDDIFADQAKTKTTQENK